MKAKMYFKIIDYLLESRKESDAYTSLNTGMFPQHSKFAFLKPVPKFNVTSKDPTNLIDINKITVFDDVVYKYPGSIRIIDRVKLDDYLPTNETEFKFDFSIKTKPEIDGHIIYVSNKTDKEAKPNDEEINKECEINVEVVNLEPVSLIDNQVINFTPFGIFNQNQTENREEVDFIITDALRNAMPDYVLAAQLASDIAADMAEGVIVEIEDGFYSLQGYYLLYYLIVYGYIIIKWLYLYYKINRKCNF